MDTTPPTQEILTTKTGRTFVRVHVDRELCIGAASCVAVAPDAFEMDNEAKAIVKEAWQSHDDDTIHAAAQSCPTLAIFLYDQNNKKVYPEE